MNAMKLKLIFGDVTLGVSGESFHYIFSYQAGGMESLNILGKEWLYRPPRPAFWRAMTDNDRGASFYKTSGMWLLADSYPCCRSIALSVDGEQIPDFRAPQNNRFSGSEEADTVSITYLYDTLTFPPTTAEIRYTVHADGRVRIEAAYHGKAGLPQLPVFGVRFLFPTPAVRYRYSGLSGETYPDRMAGGQKGIYEIEGLPVTPYLVPQECGMHMETDWLEITRNATRKYRDADRREFCLRIVSDGSPFAFSCLPYTPQQMEFADHQEELPPVTRTVLTVCGGVRGVGGIDTWGSDVEPPYRLYGDKNIHFSFVIKHSEQEQL
ncbi:MAG: beta-galactosidase small subunit [Eubacteriales bacterium]|nr:beta-galactosidase small subunit [Eubacteriales bacterium]